MGYHLKEKSKCEISLRVFYLPNVRYHLGFAKCGILLGVQA